MKAPQKRPHISASFELCFRRAGDNIPVEVAPAKDPQIPGPIHQMTLVVHGRHLLENMKLDELAAKKVYEFAFIIQPLKLQGGTGSTVAPIAVR